MSFVVLSRSLVEVVEFVGWPFLGDLPSELGKFYMEVVEFFRRLTESCGGFVFCLVGASGVSVSHE